MIVVLKSYKYGNVCYGLALQLFAIDFYVKKCFDGIPGNEPVAFISIGNGLIDLSGGDLTKIYRGMAMSNKKIILYQP